MVITNAFGAAIHLARIGFKIFPVHSLSSVGSCTCNAGIECPNTAKHPRIKDWQSNATGDESIIREWFFKWPESNYGIVTGSASGIVVVDIDSDHGGFESLRLLEELHGPLPKTVRFKTGGGGEHLLFSYPNFRVGNKVGIKKGIDIRAEGGFIVGPKSRHWTKNFYDFIDWESLGNTSFAPLPPWLCQELTASSPRKPEPIEKRFVQGRRNSDLASEAGKLRRAGLEPDLVKLVLSEINSTMCIPPVDQNEVDSIVKSISRYPNADAEEITDESLLMDAEWPDPLAEEAYHGLAGQIVRKILPHTESDPAALLFQLLVVMGNVVGRSPHFKAEADRHGTNLFALLVGRTSKGRKGTSLGQIMSLFKMIDPEWCGSAVVSGLSSGEGLIWAVRDAPVEGDCKKVLPGQEY